MSWHNIESDDNSSMFISTLTGCSIYGISRPGTSLLRMVVAVGRKLLVFNWKHSAEWLAWCSPTFDQDSVEGFTLIRVGGWLSTET